MSNSEISESSVGLISKFSSTCKRWSAALDAGWRPVLVFEVFFRLMMLAIFTPLAAWFTGAMLEWGGSQTVSNFELAAFFLSLPGIILLLASATLVFTLFFFELGGVTMISLAALENHRLSAGRLFRFLSSSLPKLALLGLRQFVILALWAIPGLIAVLIIKKTLLGGADINFYLANRPPEFTWALVLAGVVLLIYAIIALRLIIRWIFSVPVLLIEGLSAAQAMKRSCDLVKGRYMKTVLGVLEWFAGMAIIGMIGGGIFWAASELAAWMAGDSVRMTLILGALLVALQLWIAVSLAIIGSVSLGALVARLYRLAGADAQVPEKLVSESEDKRILLIYSMAVVAMLGVGTLASLLILTAVNVDDEVLITAHRGSSLTAPENTMAAIVQAIEDGADYAEIDVQETKDGQIVLLHDKDLKRIAGLPKNIWDVTLDEISDVDIGSWFGEDFSAERVVTLEQVIEQSRGKIKLNIELKFNGHDQRLAEAVAEVVRKTTFENDSFIASLNGPGVAAVRAFAPELRTGLIVSANVGDLTQVDADVLSVSAGSVNRQLIRRAHRAGKEVHVWTVNDPVQMNTMIHLGVDNIITDRPDLLVELLAERAQLSKTERIILLLGDIFKGRL